MGKLIAIGELLIDFIGTQEGNVSDISAFEKNPGGAPANVAVCVSRFGGRAELISKLGLDAFGDYLSGVMKENGVGTECVYKTDKAKTPLAFVALDKNGERSFSFYRNPSSDLFLDESEIKPDFFEKSDILHFCSVDLVDYPVRAAHEAAIKYARSAGGIISFDPNLRYPLWSSKDELLETVNRFLPFADIVKVSEDEMFALTEAREEKAAVKKLFCGNVKIVIVTRGENGASAYFSADECVSSPAFKVKQIDATGAGDTFIGTVLFQLLKDGVPSEDLKGAKNSFERYLHFANKAASISVTRRGAINAMLLYKEVFG